MTISLNFRTLLAITLLSCVSGADAAQIDQDNQVTSEATSDQAVHGYWENPDLDYVSTSWPIDETNADDNLIDIRDMPLLEEGFIDTSPANRNDDIAVGQLGVDGGDKEMVVKLAQEISDGEHGNLHSLLIIHKDKLLFESYYLRGRVNVTHPQASATKTYTGLALGRAIQLGYLTMEDLDRPVISFFNELDSTKFVEGAERVTLHQALTMRTGIRISDEQSEELNTNPDQVEGQKLVQAIFEQSAPITEESQSAFAYGNYATPLVMQVIDTVVPGGAEEFLKNELLSKIGVSTYEWRTGLGGLPAAGWKSSFTSRTMAKFGLLAMNKGKWNGEQLIPEAYIIKANSRHVYTGDDDIYGGGKDVANEGYGYFWWGADLNVGGKTYYSSNAQGGGGQFIILIDELDLIVVTTSSLRHPKSLQITAERILPAFIE
ncbi:serine hydrolase domain-containing protein [Litorimonas sp.]|uniref:serine hydrolase domain-containing protein n=1 Tax=Litorimonas sp. TaxID=1892381 RepID=UPI003A89772A